MDIFDYIKKNKDITFKEKRFNEVDNVILSLISYLNFSYIDGSNKLKDIGKIYLERHNIKDIRKTGITQRDAYRCLELMINTERYKNIEVSNYIYTVTEEGQFSAITFRIDKHLIYVAYEGTDEIMIGWKEDFEIAYKYPVQCQVQAIKYLKKTLRIFGPRIILGGHSKGGNLALISAMELNPIKKLKIKKIYSNDGPGLRLKEFKSLKYKMVKRKLVHIVPENSRIGIMLRNDKYTPIKAKTKTILSHIPSFWLVEDDKLKKSELTESSKKLEKSVIEWLDMHNDEERKLLIDNIFAVFERSGITETMKFKSIPTLIKMIKEIKNVDSETKKLAMSFIEYNFFKKIKK